MVFIMKKLLPIILIVGGCISLAQPEVSVKLSSCRTEYRPHDATDKPGFGVKLELQPSAGISIFETENLHSSITLNDEFGKKAKPETAGIFSESGKTFAKITFKKRPEGKKVKLEGSLKISIAKNVVVHDHVRPDLLQASTIQLGDVSFNITPAEENANKGNREGERLKRAEIKVSYPASVTIVKITRRWGEDADTAFSQDIDFSTTVSEDNSTKTTTVILVDALPTPTLQISTCSEKSDIDIPVGFDITLSGAVEITTPQENK